MRILFLTPYAPNLVRVRPYNLIHALNQRGHDITIASLWETETERNDMAALRAAGLRVLARPLRRRHILWNSLVALATGLPLQARYCWQPTLARDLCDELARTPYDVIHVEHLRGAAYGLWIQKQTANSQLPIVWDSVDCISHLFTQAAAHSRSLQGRLITRLELGRTRRHEAWLVNQFNRTLVTSDVDKQALLALPQETSRSINGYSVTPSSSHPVTVLPNGVDLDYFTPSAARREAATIVFSGKMSYHANVTAALYLVNDIMPLVWAQRADVQVQIVGKDPPPTIRNLQSEIRNLQVTGSVPDMRPYLWGATLAVAPVAYGAGIQNKVLEAMSCGTPVVATQVAISALSVQPGRDLLVADSPNTFADMVLDLLDDPGRQAELGRSGRKFVESNHDWYRIAAQLEDIYHHAITHANSPASSIQKEV